MYPPNCVAAVLAVIIVAVLAVAGLIYWAVA
jgi:hypothetical protein